MPRSASTTGRRPLRPRAARASRRGRSRRLGTPRRAIARRPAWSPDPTISSRSAESSSSGWSSREPAPAGRRCALVLLVEVAPHSGAQLHQRGPAAPRRASRPRRRRAPAGRGPLEPLHAGPLGALLTGARPAPGAEDRNAGAEEDSAPRGPGTVEPLVVRPLAHDHPHRAEAQVGAVHQDQHTASDAAMRRRLSRPEPRQLPCSAWCRPG